MAAWSWCGGWGQRQVRPEGCRQWCPPVWLHGSLAEGYAWRRRTGWRDSKSSSAHATGAWSAACSLTAKFMTSDSAANVTSPWKRRSSWYHVLWFVILWFVISGTSPIRGLIEQSRSSPLQLLKERMLVTCHSDDSFFCCNLSFAIYSTGITLILSPDQWNHLRPSDSVQT